MVTRDTAGSLMMTGAGLVPTSAKVGSVTMARLRLLPRARTGPVPVAGPRVALMAGV